MLDHSFLISVLAKFGFGESLTDSIKILLYKQESCALNGGFTTKYFNLEKGARQGDPISAYLFIVALKIIFLLIKNDFSVKGTKVFDYFFLYMVYADYSKFFLRDLTSVKKLLDIFSYYSKYSGLTPNFSKCDIAGIGSLKGVEVAVCGMKCVNLKVNSIKILGIHFSYNNNLNMEKNVLAEILNIQNVLKIWCMRKFNFKR